MFYLQYDLQTYDIDVNACFHTYTCVWKLCYEKRYVEERCSDQISRVKLQPHQSSAREQELDVFLLGGESDEDPDFAADGDEGGFDDDLDKMVDSSIMGFTRASLTQGTSSETGPTAPASTSTAQAKAGPVTPVSVKAKIGPTTPAFTSTDQTEVRPATPASISTTYEKAKATALAFISTA
ncbi:hypothetical protein QYF36_015527 [Acer negundo]|nr:hypothetical protein QYF36_015527 [Acer negundo]